MKNAVLALFSFISLLAIGQNQELEKLRLIENAIHIEEPKEVHGQTHLLNPNDSLVLITFSKTTGVLLKHTTITKEALLQDVEISGFQNRYFVVLIDKTAIFYLE